MRQLARWVVGIGGVVIGVGTFLLAVTVGHCSAFGGSCPGQGVTNDVWGTAGSGAALAVAAPLAAYLWSRRGLVLAVLAGATAGVLGGLAAIPLAGY